VQVERTVFALTSDHGVRPIPEYLVAVKHQRAGRTWLGDVARSASRKLEARWRNDFDLQFETGLLTADVPALRARGIDVDSLAEALAGEVREHPGVAKAYTPRSLAEAPATDVDAARWRRLVPAGYGWLVCAVTADGYIWSPGRPGAEHGTTGEDDVEVPIAFMGPGLAPRTSTRQVRTIDIGPTLASYLGIHPTEAVDGESLLEIVALSPFNRH
jgi:arylsulfatase A-like enzyme